MDGFETESFSLWEWLKILVYFWLHPSIEALSMPKRDVIVQYPRRVLQDEGDLVPPLIVYTDHLLRKPLRDLHVEVYQIEFADVDRPRAICSESIGHAEEVADTLEALLGFAWRQVRKYGKGILETGALYGESQQ
jgi:hypothetical protein